MLTNDEFREEMRRGQRLIAARMRREKAARQAPCPKWVDCFNRCMNARGTLYDYRVAFAHWPELPTLQRMDLMMMFRDKYPKTADEVSRSL